MLSMVLRARITSLILILALVLAMGVSPAMAISEDVVSPLSVAQEANVFTEIYDQVSPSVVSISVVSRRPDTGFFGQDQSVISGGTGFILDNDGNILTNNHVIDGATEIEVSFFDGTLARARVIGLDPDSDLAVIQAELPEEDLAALQPATFGDSNNLHIGQSVLAIGSPFGQRWTLTSGIVSAIGRSIRGLTNFSIGGVIQTDAAINPGNSGGPLLDENGYVIGVNSQIISSSRSSAGIGFAIPGNLARRVARDLIDNGFVNYSYLGITGGDVTLPLIEAFALPNDTQGVVVAEVVPGGPAGRAGLENAIASSATNDDEGRSVPERVDIITAINGVSLSGIGELIAYLASDTEPGDTVMLDVMRLDTDGMEQLQVEARLTPRP